jgi:1-acyl-sn-glycerol-3-phosphate acyltransferase
MRRAILYPILRNLVRLLLWLFIKLEISGEENLTADRPLILIANHFSLFESPLIALHLPYNPTFFAAIELTENPFMRLLFSVIDVIYIHRNKVDRTALRQASNVLANDGCLLISPEGGIDPELRDAMASGEERPITEGMNSRLSAELIEARPGTAYLATRSQARLLPIAVLGGEKVLANARRLRRTSVTMRIGPAFGPLKIDPSLSGPARRKQIDAYGSEMMRHIAALLPLENRGPYQ